MEKWSGPISDEEDDEKKTHDEEEEQEEGSNFGDVDVDEGVKAPLLGDQSKSANAQPGEMGNVVSSDDKEVANRHIMRQESHALTPRAGGAVKKVSFDEVNTFVCFVFFF